MKKVLSILLTLALLLSLAGCGKGSSNHPAGSTDLTDPVDTSSSAIGSGNNDTPDGSAVGSVDIDAPDGSSAGPSLSLPAESASQFGTFSREDDLLSMEADGSFALCNSRKKTNIEGTWTQNGELYTFSAPGTALDGAKAQYSGRIWLVNDLEYEAAAITGTFINKQDGDGFDLRSDGTFQFYADIQERRGKVLGTWERKDWRWMFSSPVYDTPLEGVFENSQWTIGKKAYRFDSSLIRLSLSGISLREIYCKGEPLRVMGLKLEALDQVQLSTDVDLSAKMVKPGALTPEIPVSRDGAKATVVAINPYEKEAPLSVCIICCFRTEDTSGVFQLDNQGRCCGQKNHDELLDWDAYVYTKEKLVYKEFVMPSFGISYSLTGPDYGEKVLEAQGASELTLSYDKDTLTAFQYVCTNLYYNGLDDNLESEDLEGLDAKSREEVVENRRVILMLLKEAFRKAGLDVNIDETTGEIDIGDTVLFEKNSSDLSKAGKDFLDRLMEVYVPVLLSEQFADVVSGVRFEGHTDSSGEYGYNLKLSEKRAKAVRKYCLSSSKNGLSKQQLRWLKKHSQSKGYADRDLVFDANGKEDADASRRVAVRFLIQV